MIIDNELIYRVTSEAQESPRHRMNFNFHESLDSKAQRLLNVLLPDTVLPIHRHTKTAETYVVLKGRMFVVFFDDNATPTDRFLLDPASGNYGIHIPKGQWHGIEVIEPTTIFEVKDGPYTPLSEDDILQVSDIEASMN